MALRSELKCYITRLRAAVLIAGALAFAVLIVPVLITTGVVRAETTAPSSSVPGDAATSIQKIIVEQIDAFKRDDAEAAFVIAAPAIQQRFITPGNFISMVRTAYPSVFRAQKLMFLKVVHKDNAYHQSVLIAGPDGELVQGIYSLIQLDGVWRISGCVLVKRSGNET